MHHSLLLAHRRLLAGIAWSTSGHEHFRALLVVLVFALGDNGRADENLQSELPLWVCHQLSIIGVVSDMAENCVNDTDRAGVEVSTVILKLVVTDGQHTHL